MCAQCASVPTALPAPLHASVTRLRVVLGRSIK
jgi:hypothetical protein